MQFALFSSCIAYVIIKVIIRPYTKRYPCRGSNQRRRRFARSAETHRTTKQNARVLISRKKKKYWISSEWRYLLIYGCL